MALPDTSRRRMAAVGSLLLCSGFAVALLVARVAYTESSQYRNLAWNLVLAWVPFLLALVVYERHRAGARPLALLAPGLVWLLFLPNAPYLLTDVFLIRFLGGVPIWFDVVLVTAFAWTGLLLGFVSLYLVHTVARTLLGTRVGWGLVLAAIALSSFGIYLGRFLRWNSWDFVVQPTVLAASIGDHLTDPLATSKLLGMTVLLTGFLTAGYLTLYGFLGLAVQDAREARRRS
jgi:uncharacterized membrane protein